MTDERKVYRFTVETKIRERTQYDCIYGTGTSPGLYTEKEMQSIVSQMMPGGVQTKRIDKIEQAFERFLKRIRQNLHVVVCLSYRGKTAILLNLVGLCKAVYRIEIILSVFQVSTF